MASEETKKMHERYMRAMHAIQSGVAMRMKMGNCAEPKHLRVGIDSAMVNDCALVRLLIDKGIITNDEYLTALVTSAEEEVKRAEVELSQALGLPVTLG